MYVPDWTYTNLPARVLLRNVLGNKVIPLIYGLPAWKEVRESRLGREKLNFAIPGRGFSQFHGMLWSLDSPAESFQIEAKMDFCVLSWSLDVVGPQGGGIFFGEAVVFGQRNPQRELTCDPPAAITSGSWEMCALFRKAGAW